jgi:hypothetical protein
MKTTMFLRKAEELFYSCALGMVGPLILEITKRFFFILLSYIPLAPVA